MGASYHETVCKNLDILSPLLPAELGLRVAVRMVKDMHQLPAHIAEAVHTSLRLAFQVCQSLLRLGRYIAELLEEAPTPCPSLLGPCHAGFLLLGFPARLALSTGG
jgi:hypothetical protein